MINSSRMIPGLVLRRRGDKASCNVLGGFNHCHEKGVWCVSPWQSGCRFAQFQSILDVFDSKINLQISLALACRGVSGRRDAAP